jgi:carbon-monoxide dehydrogenase medium subunit
LRLAAIEASLAGRQPTEEVWAEAAAECAAIEALDDIHASSAYRRRLAVVMARRALQAAGARALAARPH